MTDSNFQTLKATSVSGVSADGDHASLSEPGGPTSSRRSDVVTGEVALAGERTIGAAERKLFADMLEEVIRRRVEEQRETASAIKALDSAEAPTTFDSFQKEVDGGGTAGEALPSATQSDAEGSPVERTDAGRQETFGERRAKVANLLAKRLEGVQAKRDELATAEPMKLAEIDTSQGLSNSEHDGGDMIEGAHEGGKRHDAADSSDVAVTEGSWFGSPGCAAGWGTAAVITTITAAVVAGLWSQSGWGADEQDDK